MKILKSLVAFASMMVMVAIGLPAQVGQASTQAGAGNTVTTYSFNLLDPFMSGFTINQVVTVPVTIENTGTSPDQYGVACSKVSGGDNWAARLLDSEGEQLFASCLTGTYYTGQLPTGESLKIQVELEAPSDAAIGDYLRINVTVTSGNDSNQSTGVVRQGAVSAPFIQNFSDYHNGRKLQVSNPKFFFTRAIGPQIEWPSSLSVTYINSFSYINSWGYALGTHINIEYEVMNIRSGYPPSVVQLTDNPDRVADHSTAMAVAPNGITGVIFIRTIYDPNGTEKQKQNVYFARIDARGLPLGLPVPVTNNSYFGFSDDPDVPFFGGTVIRATPDNRFILAWAELENSQRDIIDAVYDSTSGTQVVAPHPLTTSTDLISYNSPNLAGLKTSAPTFLTYIANEPGNSTTPITLWGTKLDSSGAIVGAPYPLAAINGSSIDTVQLWDENILVAWINNDQPKLPTYLMWDTNGNVVKSPTALDSLDGRSAGQIAVTYDQFGHGILTWGNQNYNRIYYALVDGSGVLLTPAMIQREAQAGLNSSIDLGSSNHSTAFLVDPIDWQVFLPLVRK